MTYYETQQQNPAHNSQFNPQQWAAFNSQAAQPYGAWSSAPSMQAIGGYGPGGFGLGSYGLGSYGHGSYGIGQPAYGQQNGQYGGQPSAAFGYSAGWGAQPQGWGQQQPQWGGQQQRQLSQQDVSEVVRQLVPALPQILAQAQQPHAAIGYAAYGQAPRTLSQQDVNDVVRQILPIVPQIVGMLQGQPQLQYAAMQGGFGLGQQGLGQQGLGQQGFGQQGFGQQGLGQFGQGNPLQNFGAQFGAPQFQSAFGTPAGWGQQQRQLTQQDVADVTRQLVGVIPQVIGNLQAFNQQRMI